MGTNETGLCGYAREQKLLFSSPLLLTCTGYVFVYLYWYFHQFKLSYTRSKFPLKKYGKTTAAAVWQNPQVAAINWLQYGTACCQSRVVGGRL